MAYVCPQKNILGCKGNHKIENKEWNPAFFYFFCNEQADSCSRHFSQKSFAHVSCAHRKDSILHLLHLNSLSGGYAPFYLHLNLHLHLHLHRLLHRSWSCKSFGQSLLQLHIYSFQKSATTAGCANAFSEKGVRVSGKSGTFSRQGAAACKNCMNMQFRACSCNSARLVILVPGASAVQVQVQEKSAHNQLIISCGASGASTLSSCVRVESICLCSLSVCSISSFSIILTALWASTAQHDKCQAFLLNPVKMENIF